jgi:hypothetical protein
MKTMQNLLFLVHVKRVLVHKNHLNWKQISFNNSKYLNTIISTSQDREDVTDIEFQN